GRPALESHHVVLVHLELDRVLDGDDPLVIGDERRQHVEQRRLAGPGPAGDEGVESTADTRPQQLDRLVGERAHADEVIGVVRIMGELPYRQYRSVDGEGRDYGVD